MNCNNCGTLNDDNAQFCSNCGASLSSDQEPVGEQEHAAEQEYSSEQQIDYEYYEAALGYKNTAHYLPTFKKFDSEGISPSWNWPAFFVSFFWLLYRKMWGYATAYFFLPILLAMIAGALEVTGEIGEVIGVAIYLGVLFILFPMYADALLYGRMRKWIAEIMSTHPERDRALRLLAARGGVSTIAVIVFMFVVPIIYGILVAMVLISGFRNF